MKAKNTAPNTGVRAGRRVWDHDSTPPGPRIVLIHGSMDRQSGFRKLARSLSSHHRVVSYDRRGYATSAEIPGPYSMDYQVADLLAIVEGEPSVLIGHSFGGAVALAFAERHPALALGAVVYESPMSWEPWWSTDSGGAQAVAMSENPEQAAETFLKRFIGERLWNRLPEATRQERRAEGRALVGELGDLRRFPAWHASGLHLPVVSGCGTLAREYVRRGAEIIGSLVDSRFVELDGAHHNAHSAEPAQFENLLVQPLLRRIESGTWDI